MIRRNTWLLLIVLLALIGFAIYFTNQKTKQAAAVTPISASTSLFNSAEGTPNDIKVEDSTGNSVEVARNASGSWEVKAPVQMAADQAAAQAAATQIGTLRVLANPQLGLDVVGLDKPAYTITIIFSGGKTHKLSVGSVTPIQDGYYTSLDVGPAEIVDKPGLDALLGLLTAPPYFATLTPAASPTPFPALETPTSEATLSPGTPVPTDTSTKAP
jgi:hypothetical protein